MTLTALVLILKPTTKATVPTFLGRAAHAWFLDQVGQVDSQLAQRLHTPDTPRAFTVSSLWSPSTQPHRGTLRLAKGQTCYLRITGIAPDLSRWLLETCVPRWTETTVYLTGVPFHVSRIAREVEEHPQAACLSYEALMAQHLTDQSPSPSNVTLRFLTPTTFRRSPPIDTPFEDAPYDVPLPLPSLVFGGLLDIWNAFAPKPMPEDLRTFAQDCVVVSRYRLHTELVAFGSGRRGRVGGFVGTCRFAIRGQDPTWQRRIGLLAAFAPFSGVGWRTTMGLGQARLLM